VVSRKSPSVARSAPRAEAGRIARYAARLDKELACAAPTEVDALEAAMRNETLIRVGKAMREFAAAVAPSEQRREREDRIVLPGVNLPPLV
jgi:hypothetical protein